MTEPAPVDWASLREHLAMLEWIPADQPGGHAFIREFLARMPQFAQHIAEPMPPDVAAQIARLEKRTT